jgi:hypothetical protein
MLPIIKEWEKIVCLVQGHMNLKQTRLKLIPVIQIFNYEIRNYEIRFPSQDMALVCCDTCECAPYFERPLPFPLQLLSIFIVFMGSPANLIYNFIYNIIWKAKLALPKLF